MQYLVMGAGALGSVFGGLLQEKGCDVSFVGLDDHLRAMQDKGLTITGLWGEHRLASPKAFYGVEGLCGTFDVVLLCVKSFLTPSVMRQVRPFLREDTLVVSVQNGLGNWESIAHEVGWHRTVGGRIIFGAEVVEPGTARVTVYADKVLLGSPSGEVPPERITPIVDDLNAAGIPTELSTEIATHLWGKVLYNCCLNPLGAILNVPYGDLAQEPQLLETIRRIIDEIFAVARAKGVRLAYANPEDYFRTLIEVQLPPTLSHRSSMLQDLERSRPTEIAALNGAVSSYGRELGVATPVNDVITALIRGLERRRGRV